MTSDPVTSDSPRIAILDHGSGNLRSAVRALARAGADVELTDDPAIARRADGLVVPGVGAFATCMTGLRRIDGVELIREWAAAGRPLLGICVGFQVLFESGTEHGETAEGCGVLTGGVTRLEATRLPHMGWNTVEVGSDSRYFGSATAEDRYYFVHSYGVAQSVESGVRLAATDRPVTVHTSGHDGARFVAAVESGLLLATQFHPEKSADSGAALLREWVSAVRNG